MITGQIWLRVPESIKVTLTGARTPYLSAKDVALALVKIIGPEGANYQTLEFHGSALAAFSLEERMVICNLAVEMDAKAAIFPADAATHDYLAPRQVGLAAPVAADVHACYARDVTLDLSKLSPRVALPHAPDNVVPIEEAAGTPVQMVFIGTCTGGRVRDFHEALAALERAGGRIAPGVQLVLTPASREVAEKLRDDGTLARYEALGAAITTAGCGACCGTSGVIPRDGMSVLSTANRNFKARMGNATASIYLASPSACGAAAATGRITDPRAERAAR
jgi:3-isopropylmalate/(R)-2-methylmalate dehydratase large subunit